MQPDHLLAGPELFLLAHPQDVRLRESEAPRPLLTIAIPTFNRSSLLEESLTVLVPQLAGHPEVELLICDNASPDNTEAVVERFRKDGVRYQRNAMNIGSDANFINAFHLARGKYFWLLSDDDIPVPNIIDQLVVHLAVTEYDLIYLTSYGYRSDWRAERATDKLHRQHHVVINPLQLARMVNVMFTFISGMITNKSRLLELQAGPLQVENPTSFSGTNLPQLSWTLPLLRSHRQSLVLWQRPIAARIGHNGGYELATVFGENLSSVTRRCLPDRPDIAEVILSVTLRSWFPSMIHELRRADNQNLSVEKAHETLRHVFQKNFRYWLFTYPVIKLPLTLAKCWLKMGSVLCKLIYVLSVPGFWRKRIGVTP